MRSACAAFPIVILIAGGVFGFVPLNLPNSVTSESNQETNLTIVNPCLACVTCLGIFTACSLASAIPGVLEVRTMMTHDHQQAKRNTCLREADAVPHSLKFCIVTEDEVLGGFCLECYETCGLPATLPMYVSFPQ